MSNSIPLKHDGMSMTPREALIYALSVAVGDHARAIVDALDEYLAEDPNGRVPAFLIRGSNSTAELERARAERDAALVRAENAERALAEKKRSQKPRKRRSR